MAKRLSSEDLKDIIRGVVREEIQDVVKATINEVLSERYLKQLAEGMVRSAPRAEEEEVIPRSAGSVRGLIREEEEEVEEAPAPRPAPRAGPTPTRRDLRAEVMADMGEFFEGTVPLNEIEERQEEGVPLEKLDEAMTSKWRALAGTAAVSQKITSPEEQERAERMLQQRRQALEVPVR